MLQKTGRRLGCEALPPSCRTSLWYRLQGWPYKNYLEHQLPPGPCVSLHVRPSCCYLGSHYFIEERACVQDGLTSARSKLCFLSMDVVHSQIMSSQYWEGEAPSALLIFCTSWQINKNKIITLARCCQHLFFEMLCGIVTKFKETIAPPYRPQKPEQNTWLHGWKHINHQPGTRGLQPHPSATQALEPSQLCFRWGCDRKTGSCCLGGCAPGRRGQLHIQPYNQAWGCSNMDGVWPTTMKLLWMFKLSEQSSLPVHSSFWCCWHLRFHSKFCSTWHWYSGPSARSQGD